MRLLKNVNIDWMGKRWLFIGISLVIAFIGLASMAVKGFKLGVDFTGGTLIQVKFKDKPDTKAIQTAVQSLGIPIVQIYGRAEENEVLIKFEKVITSEKEGVGKGEQVIFQLLRGAFDPDKASSSLTDLNNASKDELTSKLMGLDPAVLKNAKSVDEMANYYRKMATDIVNYRTTRAGIIKDFSELKNVPGLNDAMIKALQSGFYLGSFVVRGVDSVGPTISKDLQRKATYAVIGAFAGMLIYIGFRFRSIYGVGAIVAVFHDVLVTLGLFSLTNIEISLNVIAALLTLVGYSVNDTIVIFDRVRENWNLMRKDKLETIINTSMNQTLSRTILASGMTFLSVLSLLIFGGEVLRGFSFVLTIGILVGTYSTLSIASPIVIWWAKMKGEQSVKL